MNNNSKSIGSRGFVLVLLCLLVVAATIGAQIHFGNKINSNGPQQLAAIPEGGYYLATADTLYRLNEQHEIRGQWSAAELGVKFIDAIATGPNNRLWLHGWDERHLRQCELGRKQFSCNDFGKDLRLPKNVSLADYPASKGVAIAYNQDHQLQIVGSDGVVIDTEFNHQLRYPNQVQTAGQALIIADTDQRSVMQLENGKPPQIVLTARSRPYRFVVDAAHAYTVETGITLNDGKLFQYNRANGASREIATDAVDIIDIMALNSRTDEATTDSATMTDATNTGALSQLVVISRSDFQWFSIDINNNFAITQVTGELAEKFAQISAQDKTYRQYQRYVPFAAALLILPLLVIGVRDERAKQRAATAQAISALQAEPGWLARYDASPARTEPQVFLPSPQMKNYALAMSVSRAVIALPIILWIIMIGMRENKAFAEQIVSQGIYAFDIWQLAGIAIILVLSGWLGVRRYRNLMASKLTVTQQGLLINYLGRENLVSYDKVVVTEMWLMAPRHSVPLIFRGKRASKIDEQEKSLWDVPALKAALAQYLTAEQFPTSLGEIVKQIWQRRIINNHVGSFILTLVLVAGFIALALLSKY